MAAGKRRVLVVDGSRVVRTMLSKRLVGFVVVEEDNGESAWQRLMLDGGIVAVISSINPPRLTAEDLLGRMRSSALRRLRETPLVVLTSDDHLEADDDGWLHHEAAGFMTKSMSGEAMTECLEKVLAVPEKPREEEADGEFQDEPKENSQERAQEKISVNTRASRTVPLLETDDFLAAVASLPHEMSSDEPLCALVFGIDRLDELIHRFGSDVPDLLTGRIAKLLAAKIDPRDVLGWCGRDHVAIVSHGVDLKSGVGFGKRVCKSMATGQIAVHGRKIRLTTSVGVAATSDDRVASPEDLLALAQARLKQAMSCGGNCVCTELRPDCPLSQRDKALVDLFRLLGKVLETEQKEALGAAVHSLLRKIDAKLAIDAKTALDMSNADTDPAFGDIDAKMALADTDPLDNPEDEGSA
jgi:diguanylate cyclase (GGDEF)-like protein